MGGHATKNVDCPVCDFGGDGGGGGLGTLAQEVPFSHHANSTIVCYITGKIMDADNMPLAFPDTGYVYSREVRARVFCVRNFYSRLVVMVQAMEEMSLKNDGVVTCPRSKATCKFSALRRVYIS
jgi:macrophage erythroblast attacher